MVPSSRYKVWNELGEMLGSAEAMGWMPSAKRIGERGSPC